MNWLGHLWDTDQRHRTVSDCWPFIYVRPLPLIVVVSDCVKFPRPMCGYPTTLGGSSEIIF
jgi:hypothetical protein